MEQQVPLTDAQRLRGLVYHAVDINLAHQMTVVRREYYNLGLMLLNDLPDSRERSLALTALEGSCLRAIQCLAVSYGDASLEDGFDR